MLIQTVIQTGHSQLNNLIGWKFGVRGNLAIAKSLISSWCTEELGITMVEIGQKIGVSWQAIACWVHKGRLYCQSET